MRRFEVEDGQGRRLVEAADFPLAVGGADGDLRLESLPETVAWLGLDAGDLFLQPVNGQEPHDGESQHSLKPASQWLEVGQEIQLAGSLLRFESGDPLPRLRLSTGRRTAPPAMIPPPRRPAPGAKPAPASGVKPAPATGAESAAPESPHSKPEHRAIGRPITPIVFEPAISAPPPAQAAGRGVLRFASLSLLLILIGAAAFFLFSARSVKLTIDPVPSEVAIEGTLWQIQIGDRHLIRPGSYSVRAEKDGYRPLTAALEVGEAPRQEHSYTLRKEPGRLVLDISSEQESLAAGDLNVTLEIDGETRSWTPGAALELEAGAHVITVAAPRHRPVQLDVEIEGAGREESQRIVLEKRWAAIRFESRPAGARLRIDGQDHGRTPATLELIEGARVYSLSLAGYTPRRGSVTVVAGQESSVGPLDLRPSDGNLSITSQPEGASVRVGGAYRGKTPVSLALEPGIEHVLTFDKLGHSSAERRLEVGAGESAEVHVELEQEVGRLRLTVFPSDAEVLLDGAPITERDLELAAAASYELEVRKAGFVAQKRKIKALANNEQSLEIRLESVVAAREKEIQQQNRTSEGQELKLIAPGRLRMGASRRESGRRANETLRDVELTRRFYISAQEITNEEFRRFRPQHRSGSAGGHSLDVDNLPVVQVSWNDAAAYCNWLSQKEGLEPAYEKAGAGWVAKAWDEAPPSGYRLPTEAEWSWVARYPTGPAERGLKYPWGDRLPVAEKSGNYADAAASDLVSAHLHDYSDGFAATAPTDAFAPNALGLHNLGGNVAEWAHDVYVVRPAMIGAVERDPQGPREGEFHVIRGSSWMHSTITELRLSFRDYGQDPRADVGFRIARPVL